MACRECSNCNLRYPHTETGHCRVCDEPIRYCGFRNPDRDWRQKVKDLQARIADFERAIPRIACGIIRDQHGRFWLHDIDLLRAGWHRDFTTFELVEIADLRGDPLIVQVQGADRLHSRWWVEPAYATIPAYLSLLQEA